MTKRTMVAAVLAAAALQPVAAQDQTETGFRRACDGVFETEYGKRSMDQFGFWVGEWIVSDRATGAIRGFDDIKIGLEGCVLEQHWRQLSDNYALEGAPYRMSGKSLTTIDASGVWRQVWVSSSGGMTQLSGGPAEDGTMVLSTAWRDAQRPDGKAIRVRQTWRWKPLEDGSIHNWGEILIEGENETGEPRVTYDILYQRNVPGGPQVQLSSGQ